MTMSASVDVITIEPTAMAAMDPKRPLAFAELPLQQVYNAGIQFPFPRMSIIYRRSVKPSPLDMSLDTPPRCDPCSPSTPALVFSSPFSSTDSITCLISPADECSALSAPARLLPSVVQVPEPPPTRSQQILSMHELLPEFHKSYTLVCELGTGGFGFAVRGYRKIDGLDVAIKFIDKQKMPAFAWVREVGWNNGVRPIPLEAQMLMLIRHEGVVAFIDLFEDESYFYLVMEHHGTPWAEQKDAKHPIEIARSPPSSACQTPPVEHRSSDSTETPATLPMPSRPLRRSSCDLFEFIEQKRRLTENEARYVFAQIVRTCFYLHANGVYHMDIKDENIVVDSHLRAKLIDFGSAVRCQPYEALDRFFGTIAYASPEILQAKAYLPGPAEIWSLGILFSVLLMGETLYDNQAAVLDNKYNHAAFQRLSPDCQYILHRCLHPDPNLRASIAELRVHPWLLPSIRQLEQQAL